MIFFTWLEECWGFIDSLIVGFFIDFHRDLLNSAIREFLCSPLFPAVEVLDETISSTAGFNHTPPNFLWNFK